jgi:hypothetical protein
MRGYRADTDQDVGGPRTPGIVESGNSAVGQVQRAMETMVTIVIDDETHCFDGSDL